MEATIKTKKVENGYTLVFEGQEYRKEMIFLNLNDLKEAVKVNLSTYYPAEG